jgi:hypothetical protein
MYIAIYSLDFLDKLLVQENENKFYDFASDFVSSIRPSSACASPSEKTERAFVFGSTFPEHEDFGMQEPFFDFVPALGRDFALLFEIAETIFAKVHLFRLLVFVSI